MMRQGQGDTWGWSAPPKLIYTNIGTNPRGKFIFHTSLCNMYRYVQEGGEVLSLGGPYRGIDRRRLVQGGF